MIVQPSKTWSVLNSYNIKPLVFLGLNYVSLSLQKLLGEINEYWLNLNRRTIYHRAKNGPTRDSTRLMEIVDA